MMTFPEESAKEELGDYPQRLTDQDDCTEPLNHRSAKSGVL
jgi:hypothetical protein